jgi:hypothetical protein
MIARRTPLRYYTVPLRRKPIPRTRATPRRVPAEYIDGEYIAYLRGRPCRVSWLPPHPGRDPHHARHTATGASLGAMMKDDRRAISMCRGCHTCIEQLSGPFKGWNKAMVHEWLDQQIADQRSDFENATKQREIHD